MKVSNEEKKAVECGYSLFSASLSKSHWLFFTSGTSTPPKKTGKCQRLRTPIKLKSNEVSNSLMKTFTPQKAEVPKAANTRKNRDNLNEQLFVATERNAKIRYEGYKKLAEL